MREPEKNIQQEAKNIILQFAVFRWENAVLLAGMILLTAFYPKPFNWWPIWGWPGLGLAGIFAISYSSLKNTQRNARLVLQSFQENFDLREISLPELRDDVEQALEYQRRINKYLAQQNGSPIWERANDTAGQIQNWIENVYKLARHLDNYRADKLIKRELSQLPGEIKKLDQQQKNEKNPVILNEIEQLLESKNKYLETMRVLDSKMKQAELQLENSLSALATVDSQIRLIAAQDVDRSSTERLRNNIQEQINRLGDLIVSITEVYEMKS